MLEYFTYRKLKKNHAEKLAKAEVKAPVLTPEDEHFLERIVTEEGTPPALPERPFRLNPEVGDPTNNHAQMVLHQGASPEIADSDTSLEDEHEKQDKHKDKGKSKEYSHDKDKKKANRFSFLRRIPKKTDETVDAATDVSPNEVAKEEDDITRVLDELNLAAVNNRAFSLSNESQILVQKFTVILKDLINGVPTAYDDLVKLIDDSSDQLSKNYKNLPGFLQKLIKGLPQKLSGNLGPELLAVATEAGGVAGAASSGGLAGAAKRFLKPTTLKDLVTKPGAIAGMLKAIMNALKLRWPAFIGTNVILSLALFVLLFVFWYCHKRGREVRLEKEGRAQEVDSDGRIEELDDDAMLPPPGAGASSSRAASPSAPVAAARAAAAPQHVQPAVARGTPETSAPTGKPLLAA